MHTAVEPGDDPEHATLMGTVETSDGMPASEAWVALNALGGRTIAAFATDATGRFEAPRPDEAFAITVTGTNGTARFMSAADVDAAPQPIPIRLEPSGHGLTVRGWSPSAA